jgi:quercetin dioxygenase-like cupin family protein
MKCMIKENIYTAKEKKVNDDYFTGNVLIREILGESNSAEQEMYHVTFNNGALTTLHFHESDQILIATKGKGVVGSIKGSTITECEIDDNDITLLENGDTVLIRANKIHFHGAIGKEEFSHIAIRKIYKANVTDSKIKKADNKWQYDLISEEIGSKDPELIKNKSKQVAAKVQMAIQRKIENNRNL